MSNVAWLSNRKVHRAGLATIGAVAVALAIAFGPWGKPPGPDFYASAAQVIPVLLVALAVEGSARELWSTAPSWLRVVSFSVLSIGEISAVLAASGVVARDDASNVNVGPTVGTSQLLLALTVAGLIVGFLLVMYLAFFQGPHRKKTEVVGSGTVPGSKTAPRARFIRW